MDKTPPVTTIYKPLTQSPYFTAKIIEMSLDSIRLDLYINGVHFAHVLIQNFEVPEMDIYFIGHRKPELYYSSSSQEDFREYMDKLIVDLNIIAKHAAETKVDEYRLLGELVTGKLALPEGVMLQTLSYVANKPWLHVLFRKSSKKLLVK